MKLLISFVVFVFILNEAVSFTGRQRQQFQEECFIENGLDISVSGFMEKLEKGLPVDKKTCYFACLYKKMGMLKDDGSYSYDDFLKSPLISESDKKGIRDDMKDTVNLCTAKVGNDQCELAACLSKTYGF